MQLMIGNAAYGLTKEQYSQSHTANFRGTCLTITGTVQAACGTQTTALNSLCNRF